MVVGLTFSEIFLIITRSEKILYFQNRTIDVLQFPLIGSSNIAASAFAQIYISLNIYVL